MFDAILKSRFYTKCKTDLKMVRIRIEMIKKKRNATEKYLTNDVADLLKNAFDNNAYARAEGLIGEMNRSECYDLIDQYCDLILNNLSAMDKQSECPEQCREAAAGLMFAAARFADLPELRDLRSIFSDRYGTSLDYYVNKQFQEKLKSSPPSNETKLQLLRDIAAKSGIEWSSVALENELFGKPPCNKNLDKRDGSLPKHAPVGSGYEYYPARELYPEHEKKQVSEKENRSPKVKDIQVDTIRKPLEDEDKPNYKWVPPPYTKKDEAIDMKARSVRTRTMKPLRDESSVNSEETNKEKAALGQRIMKFFDGGGHDQRDGEEKMLDELLQHYSGKKGPNLEPNVQKRRRDPSRVSSLPAETTPAVESNRTHARAASFHQDAHVHPKLPDYDDFVARLAAYRGK